MNEHLEQTSDQLVSKDINRNEENMRAKCDICDRSYSNVKSLNLHKSITHRKRDRNPLRKRPKDNEKTTPFKCDICHRSYSNKNSLRMHKYKYHNIRFKPVLGQDNWEILNGKKIVYRNKNHSCDWPGCDYKGRTRYRVEQHKIARHYPDDTTRKFACSHPGCDWKFKTKRHLTVHLETHKTREGVQCQHCGKDYKDSTGLKTHILHQHNNERNFVCNHSGCQYSTTTASRLKVHASSHSDRSIACTVDGCDKLFRTSKHLKNHLTSHITEYRYKCPFDGCDKTFKTEKASKTHYKKLHSERELIRCDWPGCDFETKSRASYLRHRDVHKTERDFLCEWPECGKGFKNKRQLNCHIRRHTNDKRYVCLWPGCQYSTTDSANSIKHRKQVHEKNSNYYMSKK